MRYLELIFEGKTYSSESKIDTILEQNNLDWLIDAEIENAILEIKKNTLIWNGGTFYSGDWHYGIFKNGKFYGNWKNGIFENGEFLGKWNSGINHNQ
jgi:hypothetical protein